jgi:hypothetical protein
MYLLFQRAFERYKGEVFFAVLAGDLYRCTVCTKSCLNKILYVQGSTLVKHFSKFTKDIFASLICLLFIYEALYKLYKVGKNMPLS